MKRAELFLAVESFCGHSSQVEKIMSRIGPLVQIGGVFPETSREQLPLTPELGISLFGLVWQRFRSNFLKLT